MSDDDKLGKGTTVKYYSFFDAFKGIFIVSLILAIFIGIGGGNILLALFGWIPLLIPVWFFKMILQSFGLISVKLINTTIIYKCPHCNTDVWYYIPQLRMKCPNCKNEVGFHDNKVYEITKSNEKFFKTESEKTNDLLENQINKESNTNLDELKKLKELLDMDAITKEEFDKKKKELLK